MTQSFLPTITGIVLMVPEAQAVVATAHITILAPFGKDQEPTAAELADVEEYFAAQTPFAYQLTQVCTFPNGGVRYLSPEPAAAFARLTHGLHQVFPEYPPYEGKFDLVVPHLTIPDQAEVGPLPIRAYAREAAVVHVDRGALTELATFPLGATAA